MRQSWFVVWFSILLAPGCNCGGNGAGDVDGGGGGTIDDLVSIAITPADPTLTTDGITPATATFTATGTFTDSSTRDITAEVAWSLDDPGLGTMNGPAFTGGAFGGRTVVRASAGEIQGTTTLTVVFTRDEPVSEGVGGEDNPDPPEPPPGAVDLFDGPEATDAAKKPRLVYPNDGVLVPPNLGKLEFHFEPGSGNTVFELAFENAITDLRLYLVCGPPLDGGCIYQPALTVWRWLAETNRGQGPVTVTVRATDGSGTEVATGDPIELEFSHDDLRGAVYYWSTSRRAILRWDFASTTQTEAELYFGDGTGTGTCVGCHALSRDGSRITIQERGQDSGDQYLLEVATRTELVPFPAPERAVFTSWSPDGDRYVGVYDDGAEPNGVDEGVYAGDGDDDQLLVVDGTTGQRIEVVQAGGTDLNPLNHPDWSPADDKIAFVSVGDDTRSLQKFHTGQVGFVERDGGGTFGAPVMLTPQTPGTNHYYPAFSPDGELLVYNRSTCPAGQNTHKDCNADTDPTATLMFVQAEDGATPVEGTRANTGGIRDNGATALANSFPKWCPFEFQRTGETGSRLMWLTFSSTRRYGLRQPPPSPNPGDETPVGTLIWMVAVDPDAVAQGLDPTFPAFVLPFQDRTTSNHIGQWTEAAPDIVD